MTGFSDVILDVVYRTDSLGDKGPNLASRSADGDKLTFDFLFPLIISNSVLNLHKESYFMSINSNAT